MAYRFLSAGLWPIANAAADYFKENWGVSSLRLEESICPDIERRPTLHALTSDGHYLCVEVSESPYPTGLDSFVLDCRDNFLPVRLFVAIPAGSKDSNYKRDLDQARIRAVGVLEISGARVQVLQNALSQSLAGVRLVGPARFPKKYRFQLSKAESTFRGGDPQKGCSLLYDEIESLSRRVAEKTYKKGYWRPSAPGARPLRIRFATHPWQKLMSKVVEGLDPQRCRFLPPDLLGRVLGITSHRNDSAHKLNSLRLVMKRDRELRTRFESATDILFDLVNASKPLRV